MRIELPSNAWADAVQRADDDAHTLTVAALPAVGWVAGAWQPDTALSLRTEVTAVQGPLLTLTF
jgi:hypothetical protein